MRARILAGEMRTRTSHIVVAPHEQTRDFMMQVITVFTACRSVRRWENGQRPSRNFPTLPVLLTVRFDNARCCGIYIPALTFGAAIKCPKERKYLRQDQAAGYHAGSGFGLQIGYRRRVPQQWLTGNPTAHVTDEEGRELCHLAYIKT